MRTSEVAVAAPRWKTLATMSLVTAVALTACSSTPSSPKAATAGSSASSSPAATGPITSAALYAKLRAGALSTTSAHLTMSVKAGSQTALTAQGDEKMAGGKITAMSLNEQAAGINLQFLLVDENVYVKLPANLNKSGKPWQKATKGSTNPVLKQLATSMSSVLESASVGQYAAFASSSTVKTIGVEQVNGTTATHYKLMVDITKVRSASITPAVKQALAKAGIKKIPVDMWVDGEGRPVKVSETITLQGQAVSTNVNLTKVNEPVTITAPPASQVATS